MCCLGHAHTPRARVRVRANRAAVFTAPRPPNYNIGETNHSRAPQPARSTHGCSLFFFFICLFQYYNSGAGGREARKPVPWLRAPWRRRRRQQYLEKRPFGESNRGPRRASQQTEPEPKTRSKTRTGIELEVRSETECSGGLGLEPGSGAAGSGLPSCQTPGCKKIGTFPKTKSKKNRFFFRKFSAKNAENFLKIFGFFFENFSGIFKGFVQNSLRFFFENTFSETANFLKKKSTSCLTKK